MQILDDFQHVLLIFKSYGLRKFYFQNAVGHLILFLDLPIFLYKIRIIKLQL